MSPRDVIGSQAKIGAHISAVALTGSVNVFLVKNFHFLSMYVVTTALLPLGSYLSLYAFIAAAGDGLDLSQRHLFLLPPSPPPPAAPTLLRSVRRRAHFLVAARGGRSIVGTTLKSVRMPIREGEFP